MNIQNLENYKFALKIQTAQLTFIQLVNTTMLLIGIVFLAVGLYYLVKNISIYKQALQANNLQYFTKQEQRKIKFGGIFYLALASICVGIVLVLFACTQFKTTYIQYLQEYIYSLKLSIKSIERALQTAGI